MFHPGVLTQCFLNTLTSFSYVCLPLYFIFKTCYRWLFISWLPILPSGKLFFSKVLQVAILFNPHPATVFGSSCQLHKQFLSGQSLTQHRLAAMVNRLTQQSICSGTCSCQVIVAVWNFSHSKQGIHLLILNTHVTQLCRQSKQKVLQITWPVRHPITRTLCIKELCALQPI